MFDIRKTDGRSQSCAEYQLSKVKHKCNEIYNQNHNKQNNKDNEPKSATAMYGLNGVQKHTIQNELQAWRDNFTCEEAMSELRSDLRDKRWTVGILFSGGLLDTFAAVRSEFTPIWGCETNSTQARMWKKFTDPPNYGDVVGPGVREMAERPRHINLEHLAWTIAEAVASSGHTAKRDGASLNKQTLFKNYSHGAFVWTLPSMHYL